MLQAIQCIIMPILIIRIALISTPALELQERNKLQNGFVGKIRRCYLQINYRILKSNLLMKKITFLLTLILFVSASIAQTKVQKYSIKSGYIEYALSGNTTGTKSIWWDDYGQKSRTEENSVNITKMFGVKSETKTHVVTIINEGRFWTIDMNENTGQTGSVPYTKLQSDYAAMTESEKKQFEDDLLDSFGGKRTGTEKVEGYSCEIIEMMGVK